MIRWRQKRDNGRIIELVRTQLVPISSWQHPTPTQLRSDIHRRLRRGATLVATRNRSSPPIGFLHMEFRDTRMLIDLIAVDPRHQNHHLGTELMNSAERYGRSQGYQISYVYVDEDNERAIRFYRRLGYNPLRTIAPLKVIELNKHLR
ncbi:MAG: GNAT family N-acetyltransferase [Candidatus Cohnella colombiensis]|uniref:GNAT family N-acetyltransferase n=1 Tax=Candidatus Cohnella colombiensis TaxID=3121368 RepID=A0AA95EYJ5_9BACL|nr:MAG: GNAT family N-acetyltransferase [Cohnella sp.]